MKGLVFHGPRDVRYETNVPDPKITSPDDVLVEIAYCGICGTDLKEFFSETPNFFPANAEDRNEITGLKAPLCMGHEMSGTVVEVGKNVNHVKVGDQVVIDPSVHCSDAARFPESQLKKGETCSQCRYGLTNICDHSSIAGLGAHSGGLADKFICSSKHAIVVPKSIPLEIAALTQPLAVSYHAVRRSGFQEGSSALILGAGAIGSAAILCCYGFKASNIVVSEPSEVRREYAKRLGATVFDPSIYSNHENELEFVIRDLRKLSPNGEGFDYAFDCSGFPATFQAAIESTVSNGTIVNVAIWGAKPIEFWPMDITRHEKKIMGSMCYTTEDFEGVLKCFDEGSIDVETTRSFITTVVDLQNGIEGGFQHLNNNKKTEIKVLITPNNHGELEYSKSYTKVFQN